MRFIILAPFASLEADRDAAIISVLGDHTATTIYQLAHADHPINQGRVPSDADLHANVVAEIITGAVPVVHPELKGTPLKQLLHVCQYLQKPVLTLEDLTTALFSKATFTQEDVDALNVITTLTATSQEPQQRPLATYPMPGASQSAPQRDAQRIPVARHTTSTYHDPGDEQPEQTSRRVTSAPARTSNKARTLGDHARAFQACLLRWEQRANAFLGQGLKNPNSRDHQPLPRPYSTTYMPPATTG